MWWIALGYEAEARKELASNAADLPLRRLAVQHVMFTDKRKKAMPSGTTLAFPEEEEGEMVVVVVGSICGKLDEEDA